jgi:hypothetical protein
MQRRAARLRARHEARSRRLAHHGDVLIIDPARLGGGRGGIGDAR